MNPRGTSASGDNPSPRSRFRSWWSADFDYSWMPAFLERRGALKSLQWLIAGGCALLGFHGVMWEVSTAGTSAGWQRIIVGIVAISAFYAAIRWPTASWPTERRSVWFVLWAESALAAAIICGADNTTSPLAGAGLFVVIGMYVTLLHSSRVLLLHLLWTIATILAAVSYTLADTSADLPMLVSRLLILVGMITVIPWMLHFGVSYLKEDAQGSDRDPLTELLNRRGMAAKAGSLLTDRQHEFVATVVIDLDDFKPLNDARGHVAGDEALCLVAQRLARTVPASGLIGRLGGDEFAAIVAARDADEIDAMTTAIHDAVYSPSDPNPVSASTGAWVVRGGLRADVDPAVAFANELHSADLAMYEAKRSGGNQIVRRGGGQSDPSGKARRDQKVTSIARVLGPRRSGLGRKPRRTGTA
jgi:diguanylate cyclase (GGDEF)-like protein